MSKHSRIIEALQKEKEGLTIEEISQETGLNEDLVLCVINGTHCDEFTRISTKPDKYCIAASN